MNTRYVFALFYQALLVAIAFGMEIGDMFRFSQNNNIPSPHLKNDDLFMTKYAAGSPPSSKESSSDSSDTTIAQGGGGGKGGRKKYDGSKKCCMCSCYDNDEYSGESRKYETDFGFIDGEEYCQCSCTCGSKATMPIIPTVPPATPPSDLSTPSPLEPTAPPFQPTSPTLSPIGSPTDSPATSPTDSPTAPCRLLANETELKNEIEQALADNDTASILLCPTNITFTSSIQITTNKTISLECAERRACVFDGAMSSRFFRVFVDGTLCLRGIAMENGRNNNGGAIRNTGGTVKAYDCLFKNNQSGSGGAISQSNDVGETLVDGCLFEGNFAGAGGAIYNDSPLTSTNSFFIGNSASNVGGAILNLDTGMFKVSGGLFKNNAASEGPNIFIDFTAGPLTCGAPPTVFCGGRGIDPPGEANNCGIVVGGSTGGICA